MPILGCNVTAMNDILNTALALGSAHEDLMAGYGEALDLADLLDPLNKAFIYHVVAISSDAAFNRLVTHWNNAKPMIAATREFAEEIAKKDHLGGVLSFAGAQAKARLDIYKPLFALAVIAGGILTFFSNVGAVGSAIGRKANPSILQQLLRLPLYVIIGYAIKIVIGYWDYVTNTFKTRFAAHDVLAATLDESEARFFQLIGGTPPRRPAMNSVGPAGAAILVLLGAAVVWFVLNVLMPFLSAD